MTTLKPPPRVWIFQWMAATLAGGIVGAIIVGFTAMRLFYALPVSMIINPAFQLVMKISLGAAIGISVGALQGLVLRPWLAGSGFWIAATVIGWAICAVGLPISSVGFWLGIAQWLVLRRSVRWSSAWILFSSAAWAIGTYSGDALCNAICRPFGSGLAIPVSQFLQFLGWGTAAGITGIALFTMLRLSLARTTEVA
jgi:hypothetical protein